MGAKVAGNADLELFYKISSNIADCESKIIPDTVSIPSYLYTIKEETLNLHSKSLFVKGETVIS